jgi:hypothetical protein
MRFYLDNKKLELNKILLEAYKSLVLFLIN